jgi:hypothetical protein
MTAIASAVAIGALALEGAKTFDGKPFPLVLSPSSSTSSSRDKATLCAWLNDNTDQLDALLKAHGGLLLRGWDGVATAADMNDVVEATKLQGMAYKGGAAVRTQLSARVFTANESPPSEKIPWHHEMAQVPEPPTHLFFFCETAPTEGGATPILDSTEVVRQMTRKHPQFMEKLLAVGVKYARVMTEEDDPTSAIGRGWKSTFLCDTRADAEAALTQLGSTWEWRPDGSLKTVTAALPAVKTDVGATRTNATAFFNSAVAAYLGWNDARNDGKSAIMFGDGEPIDPQAIEGTTLLCLNAFSLYSLVLKSRRSWPFFSHNY